jgi:hypothetical protein
MTRVRRVQEGEDLWGVKGPCSPYRHCGPGHTEVETPCVLAMCRRSVGLPRFTTRRISGIIQLNYRCQTVALLPDCEGSLRGWGCSPDTPSPVSLVWGGEIGVEITRRMVRTCCRRMPNARQRDVQSRAESRVDWGFQYPISSSMHSHMHYKALLYSGIHCALVYAYVGRRK